MKFKHGPTPETAYMVAMDRTTYAALTVAVEICRDDLNRAYTRNNLDHDQLKLMALYTVLAKELEDNRRECEHLSLQDQAVCTSGRGSQVRIQPVE